jgi:hypothetical protein
LVQKNLKKKKILISSGTIFKSLPLKKKIAEKAEKVEPISDTV